MLPNELLWFDFSNSDKIFTVMCTVQFTLGQHGLKTIFTILPYLLLMTLDLSLRLIWIRLSCFGLLSISYSVAPACCLHSILAAANHHLPAPHAQESILLNCLLGLRRIIYPNCTWKIKFCIVHSKALVTAQCPSQILDVRALLGDTVQMAHAKKGAGLGGAKKCGSLSAQTCGITNLLQLWRRKILTCT